MDDGTVARLHKVFAAMDAGTSPLTNQDVTEALKTALFPLDAPSVAPDPVVAGLRDASDDAGHQVGVVNFNVILATLEGRLKRKTADPPANRKEG
jgi:hypothetical protein